jgi:4,5:9,10-diseco-3-hydroxy-5,9,17-trioxoandrosta-1(10),2-diene-4-oate hydrolase
MELTYENTTRFAQAGDIRIHYHEAGDGPVIIMIPGTTVGASAWGLNRHNLKGLSKYFRVILYNPPPISESDKSVNYQGPLTGFYAQILLDFMDALGIVHANLFAGTPGTGQIIRLANRYPERVEKLILQCGPGLGRSLFTPPPSEGSRLSGEVRKNINYENVLELMRSMIPRDDHRTEEIVMDRYLASVDPKVNEARPRITGPREDISGELPKILQPTLIIWGIHERDVPLDMGLRAASLIPNARFHVFGDKTGHFPNIERVSEFNRLIIDFLSH